jgi:hypothetical protein
VYNFLAIIKAFNNNFCFCSLDTNRIHYSKIKYIYNIGIKIYKVQTIFLSLQDHPTPSYFHDLNKFVQRQCSFSSFSFFHSKLSTYKVQELYKMHKILRKSNNCNSTNIYSELQRICHHINVRKIAIKHEAGIMVEISIMNKQLILQMQKPEYT